MTTESQLESDLRALVPRAMSEDSRDALMAVFNTDPGVDKMEQALHQLRPQPLSEPARQGIISRITPLSRRRIRPLPLLSMAALFTMIGMVIAMMMLPPPGPGSQGNRVLAGGLAPAIGKPAPEVPTDPATVEPEFTQLELVNTYVLDKSDNGVIDLADGKPVRQVSYQLMDELHWRSNREPNRRYIEHRPREEMIYISTPAY